jgi:hypothetical protein
MTPVRSNGLANLRGRSRALAVGPEGPDESFGLAVEQPASDRVDA